MKRPSKSGTTKGKMVAANDRAALPGAFAMKVRHAHKRRERVRYIGARVRGVLTVWKQHGTKRELWALLNEDHCTIPSPRQGLAIALLTDALGAAAAWKSYRDFTNQVIGTLDLESWELDRDAIRSWHKDFPSPRQGRRSSSNKKTQHAGRISRDK